jgi:hypothetical protein
MKFCPSCNTNKSLNDFNKNKSSKDGLQRQCKVCTRLADKKCYEKQGYKLRIERNNKMVSRNKEFVLRYKKIFGKCVDCGIKDYRVLQFDHIKNKKYDVSSMIFKASSLSNIKNEIKKCVFRCANCHQIKTYYS